MKLINIYILKKFTYNLVIILLSLELFFVGLDLLANGSDLPQSANLKILYVVYVFMFALTTTLPLAIVFGWIATIVNFVKSNEMVAFISLGASTKDIIMAPIILSIFCITLLIGIQSSPFAYSADQKSNILKNTYFSSERAHIFFKHNEYFAYFEKLLPYSKEAHNVSIFKLEKDNLVQTIHSPKGKFENNYWVFENAIILNKPPLLDWDKSKLAEEKVPQIKLLEGFKPKILDSVYEPKSSFSTLDAFDAFFILRDQNINTDKIRSAIYNQIFVPFFILPILFMIYFFANLNSRFFKTSEFASICVFATLFVWGGFFLLYRFSANSVIIPEFGLLLPLFLLFIVSVFVSKKLKAKV
jgi:lipopolysaccharide export system permease protein